MGVVTPMNNLHSLLRSALCAPLDVVPVPIGYAVSTGFVLPDGDALSFYVVADDEGRSHFEDDGTTLPDAVARGFDMRSPQREALLRRRAGRRRAGADNDRELQLSFRPKI